VPWSGQRLEEDTLLSAALYAEAELGALHGGPLWDAPAGLRERVLNTCLRPLAVRWYGGRLS